MKIVREVSPLRQQVKTWRANGETLALVPTMGNLHAGHLSLIEIARERCDRVAVSIFINPMQFDQREEVCRYPRTYQADCEKLIAAGVDLLFFPDTKTIYPHGWDTSARVELPGLTDVLCGASRPGHFAGVMTVVAKLFNMVQADVAVFGEKDFQQLQIIRHVVEDLNIPVEIVSAVTVRESDGLAMSSRNSYLSLEERELAPCLSRVLQKTARRIWTGECNYTRLEQAAKMQLRMNGFEPDYVSILAATDLGSPEQAAVEDLVILAAAWLGSARLIDNLPLRNLCAQSLAVQA